LLVLKIIHSLPSSCNLIPHRCGYAPKGFSVFVGANGSGYFCITVPELLHSFDRDDQPWRPDIYAFVSQYFHIAMGYISSPLKD
jgi:hypothetical protein